MPLYLNIGREKQSVLIKEIKRNSTYSWTQIAKELGVNRSMVLMYQSGKCRIPKDKLEKLASLSHYIIDTNALPFKSANYSLLHPTISEMNEYFAEFMGILYGDGCLGNENYVIAISGDSIADLLYHKLHVAPLMKLLFGLDPRFKFEKDRQEMHTIISSKLLHEYLSKTFFFPVGKKKGRMHIPLQIYEKDEYKKAFLRGLFDTDGGIHKHHEKSAQVHFTSHDSIFIKEVFDLYKSLRFNVRTTGEDLEFFSRDEIAKFFHELKPKNPKHLYKYQQFLETGKVPLHRDIDYSWLNSNYARTGI